MRQLKHFIVVTICCFSVSNLGLAQDKNTDREKAKAFYNAGQQAFEREEFGKAIALFEKAYAAKEIPALLVNIARIYESVNDLRNAIKFQKRYKKAVPSKSKEINRKIAELRATYASWPDVNVTSTPSDQEVRFSNQDYPVAGTTPVRLKLPPGEQTIWVGGDAAQSKSIELQQGSSPSLHFTLIQRPVAAAQTTDGFIELNINTTGAQIRLDGRLLGVSPLAGPIKVSMGAHNLLVEGPSGERHEEVVVVAAGKTKKILVVLQGATEGMSTSNLVMWSSIGLGGASLIAGTAAGLMAVSASAKLDDCRASTCAGTMEEVKFADDVRSKAQLADVLWGCGLALGTVGTYLWFQDETKPPNKAASFKSSETARWGVSNAWGIEQ